MTAATTSRHHDYPFTFIQEGEPDRNDSTAFDLWFDLATDVWYVFLANGGWQPITAIPPSVQRDWPLSAFQDINHEVNTNQHKRQGSSRFDTTNNIPLYPVGSSAGSPWADAFGVIQATPS